MKKAEPALAHLLSYDPSSISKKIKEYHLQEIGYKDTHSDQPNRVHERPH